MKAYILISFLMTEPVVYDTRAECWEARDTINASQTIGEPAVCIPRGNYEPKWTLEDFFDLVLRLENTPPQSPDVREE